MSEYVSVNHLKFLLREVHSIDKVLELNRFSDYDSDSIDMFIDATKEFADQDFYPYLTEMDRRGGKYEDGTISVHPQVCKVLKLAGENGYICSHFDYDKGGAQMPRMASAAAGFITSAANNSMGGYMALTGGSAELIDAFGSKGLWDTYVPKMMLGQWAGTMALTEPQAGSSLSDITTSAHELEDGSYKISGQKIFISGGDQDCSENIIHLTLARIEGAPAGTKGISLFVVPKFRIKEDGTFEDNDVTTAGEFDKMGQRGYVTAHLVFGEKENCKGWLVGEPNRGLKYMFLMMNGARLEVGLTGAAIASAAYHASLQYARERPQGRRLNRSGEKNPSVEQTLIINHPDVRRMLIRQKSIVEGCASLLIRASKYLDLSHYSESEADREYYHDLVELLTPIAKTYPSEAGQDAVSDGMQVLGGYGFTTDFPLEQYYRDIRITALYEGTTGIQSLDLLGRKVLLKNGAVMQALNKEILASIERASTYEALAPYAKILKQKLQDIQKVLMHLGQYAMKGNFERYLADATLFMEMTSLIIIGWEWLDMATASKQALETGQTTYGTAFYEAQIHTMQFFYKYELSKVLYLRETLLDDEVLTILDDAKEVDAFA